MKLHALLVLCFATASANIRLTDQQLKEYVQVCLAKTRLSQGFYQSGDEAQKILTEEQKSCFLACMFKRTGIIDHDGSVNLKLGDEELPRTPAIEACITTAKEDICKLAICLHKTGKFSITSVADSPRYPRYH
ncbi:uncharacterized protein LOC100117126 [Nasonia vitripennis]|uniref:Putative odorant binding protein 30 n=1 Tax=Nasonia vitripennis TaxID=7425 RepID=G8B1N5_NASVI|nr:uncharacterized protein LOC100117126 [Nasonia vitripennis]CCD17799.1 putative odorant binding protein 30 [Nasonia vitripennis]